MSAKGLAQHALQANKEHQYALNVYTERIAAEIQSAEKLLALAETVEDEEDTYINGYVLVPNAKRPTPVLSSTELLDEESPFHEVARRRKRYLNWTVFHPMKAKEHEALAEAVRMENYRLTALDRLRQGLPTVVHLADADEVALTRNTEGVDWDRIATRVTEATQGTITRSASECEIHWVAHRHPDINHSNWSPAETRKAKDVVSRLQKESGGTAVDWVRVAKDLGTNRAPIDCMRHAIARKAHTWSKSSDKELVDAVHKYGSNNWTLVARTVSEHVTAHQCQQRYHRTLDPALKRGKWLPDEDATLLAAYAVFGSAWGDVAAYVPGRSNEQCRERHVVLSTGVSRGAWSAGEDERLSHAVQTVLGNGANKDGEPDWGLVCEKMEGTRTEVMCAKRWKTLQKAESGSVDLEQPTPKPSRRPRPSKRTVVDPPEEDDSSDEMGKNALECTRAAKPPGKRRRVEKTHGRQPSDGDGARAGSGVDVEDAGSQRGAQCTANAGTRGQRGGKDRQGRGRGRGRVGKDSASSARSGQEAKARADEAGDSPGVGSDGPLAAGGAAGGGSSGRGMRRSARLAGP